MKGSKNILMDYGIKLDVKIQYPLPAQKVDACVLSHAHLDHCGNLPVLYKYAFPTTYGTAPTLELTRLLLEDSIKIGKKNHQPAKFAKQQMKTFFNRYRSCDFNSEEHVGDYTLTFYDAGHVSGSMMTKIEHKPTHRSLVYTGDYKIEPQSLQGSAEDIRTNILITETTYADREHPDRKELIKMFIADVRQVLDSGGTALIPSFAVGRAQELLAILQENRLADRTFIDGMARKATQIVMRHPEFITNSELLQEAIEQVTWIGSEEHRGSAIDGGSIILTTAGMLNGGPVLNYITKLGHNSKIFLTGYQVDGTNGRRLMDNKPLIIDGQKVAIRTPFVFYDFSAHAGKNDLYQYVKRSNPEVVVCVHGEKEGAEEFAETLKIEGFKAYVPAIGETIKLDF